MTTQLPPASIDAEEAILGCIMFDPGLMSSLPKILPVSAFYVTAHQAIYQSAIDCHNKGHAPDFVTLSTYLQGKEVLDNIGGTTKLAQLLNRTISTVVLDRYVKLVLELYQRRQLISISYQLIDMAYDKTVGLSELYKNINLLMPEEITKACKPSNEPIITKATYSVTSKSGRKKLELEADISQCQDTDVAITKLEAKARLHCEDIWGETIE